MKGWFRNHTRTDVRGKSKQFIVNFKCRIKARGQGARRTRVHKAIEIYSNQFYLDNSPMKSRVDTETAVGAPLDNNGAVIEETAKAYSARRLVVYQRVLHDEWEKASPEDEEDGDGDLSIGTPQSMSE